MKIKDILSEQNTRKYTDEELKDETKEYFNNKATRKEFPNLFKDQAHMIQVLKNAPVKLLSKDILHNLENSDVGDVLAAKNPRALADKLAKKYNRDITSVYDGLQNGKVPAPIVLKRGDHYYLLAGNTRLMASAVLGKNLPVKLINVEVNNK